MTENNQSREIAIVQNAALNNIEEVFEKIKNFINIENKSVILLFDNSEDYSNNLKAIDYIKENSDFRVKIITEKVYLIVDNEFYTENAVDKRLIAIGDIHGEIDKLNNLLKKIDPKIGDTLVFLGDYIDRGKDSAAVVERLLKLKNDFVKCVFLKGNHEQLFLQALKTLSEEDIANCISNGGAETLKQYLLMKKNDFEKFKIHIKFFKSLENYYLTDEFLFVHAGISPYKPLEEQTEEEFLWIRYEFIEYPTNIPQKVIFGHTPFEEPYIEDDKIGINTGCGIYDGEPLTAYICNENKFVQSDF